MREIKFRARWKDTGKVVKDFMGDYRLDALNDDGFIVEQFTGLKDKTGREIYEGDVLRVADPGGEPECNCIVKWDMNGGWSYAPDAGYGDFDISLIGWANDMGFDFEVIGNIHKNPELLEEKP